MTAPAIDTVLGAAQGRMMSAGAERSTGAAAAGLRQNAEEFESVFLNTMLQQMFAGLEEGGSWGDSQGSDAWRGMLVETYADTIAKSGGIGIADSIQRELLALQETNGQ